MTLSSFRILLLLRTQRRPKAGWCRRRCTASSSHCLPNVCVLSTLHSVLPPKGAVHPRQVSRGAHFELLVNEANPVARPRTTKVSETPLKVKNAPLLKCCQPAGSLLEALVGVKCTRTILPRLNAALAGALKRMHEPRRRSNARKSSASQFCE